MVFGEVLAVFEKDKTLWRTLRSNAKKARFTWKKSVDAYYEELYALK